MRGRLAVAAGVLASLVALVAIGAGAFVWFGVYDISANRQHTQAVYSLLEVTMHRSVRARAAQIDVPNLADERMVARGGACYQQQCAQCHGGPGYAPAELARSMQPLPGPLVDANAKWQPAELYWIVRNGIKMSGMPAWQHRMKDEDLWAVVAFMQRLPTLTTESFRTAGANAAQCTGTVPDTASVHAVADARRGRQVLTQYACNACHTIPGITGSVVDVGPPLAGLANRQTIAGSLANGPEQLVRWIRDPQSIDPLTTMPNMQVGERDARDMAAYLATLK